MLIRDDNKTTRLVCSNTALTHGRIDPKLRLCSFWKLALDAVGSVCYGENSEAGSAPSSFFYVPKAVPVQL